MTVSTQSFAGMCIICMQCPCIPDQVLFDYEYIIAPIFFYLISCIIVWIGPYEEKKKRKTFKDYVKEIRRKK